MRRAAVLGFPFGLVGALAAACALMPRGDDGTARLAILDAYLIAHGMVLTYGDEPAADPAVMAQLRRLDRQAREAIGDLRAGPARQDESERAVAALTDYAAAQTRSAAAR